MKSFFVAAVAALAMAEVFAVPEDFREEPAKYWSFQELEAAPRFRDCPYPHSDYPGMRPILVEGFGPNRTAAEFFCYYALPEGEMPKGGFPAVLLVHGGGGTAYPKWVDIWRKKGFAVLAPDWYNQRPTPGVLGRAELPGGRRNDVVANVANMVLANSLLRSMPEVNPSNTVFVGLSWGSWYGAMVAAVDGRFNGVVEIYCGDVRRDLRGPGGRNPLTNGRFLHAAKIPMWWVVGTNDKNMTPVSAQAGFDECPRHWGHAIVPELPHSHIGFEFESVARMAWHFACRKTPLPRLGAISEKDGVVSAPVVCRGATTGDAVLSYTCDGSEPVEWKRKWHSVPAALEGDVVKATLPKGACQAFLSLYEKDRGAFNDLCGSSSLWQTADTRPYEFRLADRREDFHPPLVDFESPAEWRVEAKNAEASFAITATRQLFGANTGELNYRATGPEASVRISPPSPVPLPCNGFDTISAWVRGPRWTHGANSQTTNPAPALVSVFRAKDGSRVEIPMLPIRWMDWHWVVHRLTADERASLAGASFDGFAVSGFVERTPSAVHFDNFAAWRDEMKPLSFERRPRRNIEPLDGADQGLNTGIGRLEFPTRETTILPPPPKGRGVDFRYAANTNGPAFMVRCPDGSEADVFADGGVLLMEDAGGEPAAPAKAEEIERGRSGGDEFARWRYVAPDGAEAVVRWTFRRWGNSLVIDAFGEKGRVCEVSPGDVGGVPVAQSFIVPYLVMGPDTAPLRDPKRTPVAVFGGGPRPLFRNCAADWYRANASRIEGEMAPSGRARLRMVYCRRSDGTRVALSERFFVNVSDEFEDVLPSVPNPVSPWKHVAGARLWRAHGSSNRERDSRFWRSMHRYGIRQVAVNDHETAWRDGGESYTYRTSFAPGRGGDEGQLKFTRMMREELGYVYGPYNNFWDAAPVNARFSPDDVTRASDGAMVESWMRTYSPKIANARAWTERLVPEIQGKMGWLFNSAYCDCHTAGSPWARTDYDARVPGAGTLSASFYATSEMLQAQKRFWRGPIYSEGAMRMFYAGIIDGNYADDRGYNFNDMPWIVDFDLRELHPRECDFGMGTLSMFRRSPVAMEQRYYLAHFDSARDREELVDRFLAATLAFGHVGLLLADFCFDPPRVFGEAYGPAEPGRFDFAGGMPIAWRSYFMTQAVAARYSQADAEEIRYVAADGSLQSSTEAVLSGTVRRQQVAVRYSGGIFVVSNGSVSERLRTEFGGVIVDLPPRAWRAWTSAGDVLCESSDAGGSRSDYCESPDYVYVDGRGRGASWPKARGVGPAVCRAEGDGWEIICLGGGSCEFRIPGGRAVALDFAGNEIGPAKTHLDADGWYGVSPVAGAFSYRVSRCGKEERQR